MKALATAAIALLFPTWAMADVHMDLNVKLDLNKRILHVSATSDKPTTHPLKAEKATSFAYQIALPAPQASQSWQGGGFTDDKNLYLPSGWHPQTDEPVTFTLTLQAPQPILSTGTISDEVQHDGQYQATFTMDRPTDAIPIFSGPYHIKEKQLGKVRLRTYFYAGMDPLSDDYLDRTADYITRFTDQIGPYPFDNFHIVAAPVSAGYGFAGLTYMGARVLALPFIKDSSLGHEILHNYWGNGVFPDYKTGNWAEGLTTYMADYMSAEAASEDKARNMRLSWLRDYAALPVDMDKPVTTFVSKHGQSSQVIGYNKVAFIFHMLRREIGDDLFFASLQQFWQNYAFKTASWRDLEATFGQTSGQDLADFFQQWVYGKGAPAFTDLRAESSPQANARWLLTTQLTQTNSAFRVPVPLEITTEGETFTLTASENRTTTQLHVRPTRVSLDPDFHLFRQLGINEAPATLRDIMLAKDVALYLTDTDMRDEAITLVQRMMEHDVREVSNLDPSAPFILMGSSAPLYPHLRSLNLAPVRMPRIATTAQVWAGKTRDQVPYLVITYQDAESLRALQRPLPHYGRQNMVLFQGAKAIFKSIGQSRPLSVSIN
ncbi:M1 family metallopeptidase [Terasakiella pusilla]|uniref:M1 family metallopeptidase n=1 Tax=Terasakiella pusilla TaxID=64973 RepID=UPI00068CD95C|nr:M1 family aminopeptidase [Terasakiella pusilla]